VGTFVPFKSHQTLGKKREAGRGRRLGGLQNSCSICFLSFWYLALYRSPAHITLFDELCETTFAPEKKEQQKKNLLLNVWEGR
jgi:hypothetical protein